MIVGNTVKRFNGEPVKQVIAYVGGAGGTGKTQIIKAVVEFFTRVKQRHTLRLCAYTGTAAKLIGGSTICSIAMIRNATVAKLEKNWEKVTTLLVDEISMVGCRLLAKLCRNTTIAKHSTPDVLFGGMDVIFFGDFSQYPPVLDTPLYFNYERSVIKASTSQADVLKELGIYIWSQLTHIALLTEQMRVTDLTYQALLNRLREGMCTYEDYVLLSTRVIGNNAIIQNKNHNPIILPGNELRKQLNMLHIHKHAQCTSQSILISPSVDNIVRGKLNEENGKLVKGLPNTKTDGLPGYLPLFAGMPVYLTKNLSTELGLTNGSRGVVTQVHCEKNKSRNDIAGTKEYEVLSSLPECVIVEFPGTLPNGLTGLASNQVPVFPTQGTFSVKLQNTKKNITIKRNQLPLVPGYSCTAHKSQGQTLSEVIVDLVPAKGMKKLDISFAYVPLSRVRRMKDVTILRPFTSDVIFKQMNSQLKKMMEDFKARDICKNL